jgi:hypothetical protein
MLYGMAVKGPKRPRAWKQEPGEAMTQSPMPLLHQLVQVSHTIYTHIDVHARQTTGVLPR